MRTQRNLLCDHFFKNKLEVRIREHTTRVVKCVSHNLGSLMFDTTMNTLQNEALYRAIPEKLFCEYFELVCLRLSSVRVVDPFEALSYFLFI